jgi:hypothetical protein
MLKRWDVRMFTGLNWLRRRVKGELLRKRAQILLRFHNRHKDRLCGLVVRVLGYRSGGSGSIPGTTKKKVVGLERGPLSLMSTTGELLDRKVAAPV